MPHLQIGICDDESIDLAQTLDLIKNYDSEKQLAVNTFLRAGDLLDASRKTAFDIVLLDIEMAPPSGFEVAKELIAMPEPPIIIFITKSNAYALKGYGVAVRYLQKPVSKESLFEAMDVAISEAIAHRLTFQIDNTVYAIQLRKVQYIEIFGHYAVLHTDTDSYRFRSTLKEITGKLPQRHFISPHKSYIVNMEHIRSATSTEILMDCGAVIPIGRKKAPEFNQAFFQFLGR